MVSGLSQVTVRVWKD